MIAPLHPIAARARAARMTPPSRGGWVECRPGTYGARVRIITADHHGRLERLADAIGIPPTTILDAMEAHGRRQEADG